MKNRAGELWEEWNSVINESQRMLLVLQTESSSYDVCVHMCLSIDDGRVTYVQETLTDEWEIYPHVTVYDSRQRFSYKYTMQRRRVL